MNVFNEQTFLQILRSNAFTTDEYVQRELNVLADLLEEYGVESPSELKQKLRVPKNKSTSRTKKTKYDLFVDDYTTCIDQRNAGSNVDSQIETLVQTFQELTAANIKKFAEKFELALSSKKDASKFKTWLQTGRPPLSASEEKALLIKEITQIYQDANGSFTEEQIQKILEAAEGIKDKYSVKELKEFVQSFESDLTAGGKDKLIEKWEERLRGVKPVVQSKSKRTSKQVKSFDLENNPYKDEINGLINAFNDNPTVELRRDTIQKILDVLESVKKDYNFTEQKKFIQNVFDSKLTGSAKTLLPNTGTYLEDNVLCLPNIPSQENCQTQEEFPIQKAYVPVQADVTEGIENYVCKAIQLRDEKSDELTDENILKITEMAEEIKRVYKIEGLKSFMNALGINTIGIKNGELINKMVYYFEDVALMRFKAVRIQEMK